MSEAASTFGGLLREFRARAGLSQSDLAERANISEAAVGALERGVRKAPYRSTVILIANALGLTAQESAELEAARISARAKPGIGASHNVEAERTSFVGRESDVEHILDLLGRCRLVTVTGSGGVGKTRAALEVARHLLDDPFPEIWFIDLAPLTDGDFIASKVASTLQPPLASHTDTLPALVSALAKRHMLLILDNCEHLIAPAAQTADRLLGVCPKVTVLATSREPLNVAGEFVYRLPSLALPPDIPDSIDDARRYSAIALFIERATAADPYGTFDSRDLGAVVDTVRRLDGIPLAIELIAAQVPLLGIETLRERLYEDFSVPSVRRDLPARQQTVNATIAWSFALLSDDEKTLLSEFAIFTGGFSLAAAEDVACRKEPAAIACLSALAAKSLVNIERIGGTVRYALLESVRAFGLRRLQETGRYDAVARRHAQWFARYDTGPPYKHMENFSERSAELLRDIDNMRGAINWSLSAPSQDDRKLAASILLPLSPVWGRANSLREYRQLLEEALKHIDESEQPRAVLGLLRTLMIHAALETKTIGLIDRAVRLSEKIGDRLEQVHLFVILVSIATAHGMLDEAEYFAARAFELLVTEGLQSSILYAGFLIARHDLRMRQGRFDEARADLAAGEAVALARGDRFYVACYCYSRASTLEYTVGNNRLALEYAERLMTSEFRTHSGVAQLALATIIHLRLFLGEVEGAVQPLREYLRMMPGENATYTALEYAALYCAFQSQNVVAARLLGRVRAVEQRTPFRRRPMGDQAYNLLCSLLREQLSPEALAEAEARGAQLTHDEATAEALAALDKHSQ